MPNTNIFPQIMGIINVTPDSFSDGGDNFTTESAYNKVIKMVENGADIIDIGGESTRPGANEVSTEEEIRRVIPLIKKVKATYPNLPISIDTTKAEVALEATINGANIINDISGLTFSPEIADIATKYNISIVLMHIKGKPRTMQESPTYQNCTEEVFDFLKERINYAKSRGVKNIIADIGIGFGKTTVHNLELIRNLNVFKSLGVPLLLGISRKRFIGELLGIDNPKDRDYATALIHALLLNKNIDIIRVHNVKLLSDLKKLNQSLL